MASDTSLERLFQGDEPAEPIDTGPSWKRWIEANSKPRKLMLPPCKQRKLTVWQKRGPMTRKDWVHFYKWAAQNALPKSVKLPDPEPEPPKEKWQKPSKPRSFARRMQNIADLSKPRISVKPYQPNDPDDELTFNPAIKWGRQPRCDTHRPYVPFEVPPDFQHIELEWNFWYYARYPVRPKALKYKASQNIKRLAVPKVLYVDMLHCPYPFPEPELIEPRRAFKPKQWRQHQRRLEYLARPVSRPYWDYEYR